MSPGVSAALHGRRPSWRVPAGRGLEQTERLSVRLDQPAQNKYYSEVADTVPTDDALRGRLLDAAIRVFARQGYAGAKILDIVREAGLSTGAVYGRFRSKEDLLREAVVSRSRTSGQPDPAGFTRVAELISWLAGLRRDPLSDDDAVRLEAFITARREPEVAAALAEARRRGRRKVQPLVDAALADGTVAPGVDPEAVLFFVQTMHLGLLLQRGAGVAGPDPASWDELVARIVGSFGDDGAAGTTASPSTSKGKGKR
jgi:AcrR family transcriptional regulator